MIEVTILNYLKTALAPTMVTTERLQGMPDSYVLIEKTGSRQIDMLYASTFAIQSYGASLYEAMSLNEAVKDAMISAGQDLNVITRVELNSDYNYTDTSTKRPRYQAVFDITHYKE